MRNHRHISSSTLRAAVFLLAFLAAAAFSMMPDPPRVLENGMVVSADSLASAVGVAIMTEGGNAFDAAAAVGFALAVTYPEAGNIGGGGFMVIRKADGSTSMIDFREKAPGAATRAMFLDSAGKPVPGRSTETALAAGIPGSVDGLLMAQQRYGRLSREAVLLPAVRIAEEGFIVDARLAASLRDARIDSPASVAVRGVFMKHGTPLVPGDTLRQPELARTLRMILKDGRDGFYRGSIARLIAEQSHRDGGIITEADLMRYHAVERATVKGTYRDCEIISSSPPSSGGVVLLEMLNILERFPLSDYGPRSARASHLFAAAAQRAFADRAAWLGDPDFVKMPLDSLLAKSYALQRASTIRLDHAAAASEVHAGDFSPDKIAQTTHYSVVDREGNAASVTTTLNGLYGCKEFVDGAGFFLNNEMDDFAAAPGIPNMFGLIGGDANAVAPQKRMLSSMTPTIVLRNGFPFLVTGARGGSRIITTVAQIIMNTVDFGMDLPTATAAPRIHCQWLPDEVVVEPVSPAYRAPAGDSLLVPIARDLQAMGYTVRVGRDASGESESILIDQRTRLCHGGADPREGGKAVAY
ncbi:MAG TPA: gamma-glutamyltransferase [Bacteroidota bacterium]